MDDDFAPPSSVAKSCRAQVAQTLSTTAPLLAAHCSEGGRTRAGRGVAARRPSITVRLATLSLAARADF